MTELVLGLTFAVEYPLIVAFHPCQLDGISYSIPLHQPIEAIAQFVLICVVEEVWKSQIMWFLIPCTRSAKGKHSLDGPHSAACGLTIDYLLPKATLWFAIMAIWMVSFITGLHGKLQMFPIVLWVAGRQFWGRVSFVCRADSV